MYPTTIFNYIVGFTSIAIDLLEENFKNEYMLQGFFLKNILCQFGVNQNWTSLST